MIDKDIYKEKVDGFFSNLQSRLGDNRWRDFHFAGKNYSRKPLSELFNILNELNITIDSVVDGNVDYDTIVSRLQGKVACLPKKYTSSANFSTRFTARYMLDFIQNYFGHDTKRFLCQKFQLEEEQFEDVSKKNNILLPKDICEYIYKYLGEGVVSQMGKSSISLIQQSNMKDQLLILKNKRSFLNYFFEEFAPNNIERNYIWKIKSYKKGMCEIEGRVSNEVISNLGKRNVFSKSLQILREGFLEGLLLMAGSHSVHSKQVQSLTHGARVDSYVISFC